MRLSIGKKPKTLLNLHTLKSTSDNDIYRELIRAVKNLSLKRFPQVIDPLLRNPRVQKALPCFGNTIESMSIAKHFTLPSLDRLLEFYKLIIFSQSSEINEFIMMRERFETLIVNNDIKLCETLLIEFKETHGESFWWIKAKLILLFYKQNADEMQDFCDEVKLRSEKGIFTYYMNSLVLSTQASFPASNLKKIVVKAVEELDKAKLSHAAWLLDILFFPKILSSRDDELHNLHALTQLPLIDMYSMLTSVLYSFVSNYNSSSESKKFCIKTLKEISEKIDDVQINNSILYLENQMNDLVGIERDLVTSYENGRYEQVLSSFIESVKKIKHPINYLNIVAKSCIRQKVKITTGLPLIDDTVRNLIDIHTLSSRASQARLDITEHIVRLNGTSISLQLQALLAVAIPQFFSEKTLKKVLEIVICRQGYYLPIVKSIISSGKKIFSEDYSFFEPHNVTHERALRCLNSNDNFFEQEQEKLSQSEFLTKDFIEYKSRKLILSNSMDKLIDFAANCFVAYPESYVCFPMDKLIEYIERNFVHDMNAIVVCHYFVKFISSDQRTLLNEIFEEYLISCDKSKPSEIFDKLAGENKNFKKLFLNEICSFESLDFLDAFQSSDELRAERIKLIEHLYSCSIISREDYSIELNHIINLIVTDSATSNFSRSKVYVDESSLKRKIQEEVTALFELYKFTPASEEDEDEDEEDRLFVINDTGDENEKFAFGLLSGQKNSLLVKIIEIIHQDFLYDEAFGLDSNLSSEIRHGIFSNFMLSEVDSHHLIAEKTDANTYKPIEYWHDFYSGLLFPEFLKTLDKEFADFSEKFNDLVNNAERWMKIGFYDKASAFSFVIDIDDFKIIKNKAAFYETADELIDAVLEILWEKTEAGLATLKDQINLGLKHDVEAIFDELTLRVTSVKGNAVLGEVMSNIESAKNNTKEIIAEISEWFTKSKSKDFDDQALVQLIDIAVSCFEKIKGIKFNINKNFTDDVDTKIVPGTYVNPIILAMINLLSNCVIHSGLDVNPNIEISVKTKDNGFVISVLNSLHELKLSEMNSVFFNNLQISFSSPESLELMRKEGGTGLAKAFHHLKSADTGFDLKVSLKNLRFCSEVTYVDVNIVS